MLLSKATYIAFQGTH